MLHHKFRLKAKRDFQQKQNNIFSRRRLLNFERGAERILGMRRAQSEDVDTPHRLSDCN